ncbi:MAG: hypothetical protein Q9208_004710 [Pyrenodesmia sp. 3 TL-2023]
MDFALSLAHFCENDGPTSILCTQALPIACRTCWGPKSIESSVGSLRLVEEELAGYDKNNAEDAGEQRAFDAANSSYTLYTSGDAGRQHARPYNASGESAGCASCSFSVPEQYRMKLPPGSPGSPKENGSGTNGSPILRSKSKIPVLGSPYDSDADDDATSHQESSPTSVTSSTTTASSFHEHDFECRTSSSPVDPTTYAILRRACLRILSFEPLPKGLTSGRLSIVDPIIGLTVAWKFRLPDPYARGQQRSYALLAVVNSQPHRAMKACLFIWRAFEKIGRNIRAKAESLLKRGSHPTGGKPTFDVSNTASFLTNRTMDPDGFRRRQGVTQKARSLVEIVGDEYFFPRLHAEFTRLLRSLADRYGELLVEPQD